MAKKCPRCGNTMSKYPAISRRDNKTKICSNCGTNEAMYDYFSRGLSPEIKKKADAKESMWLKRRSKK